MKILLLLCFALASLAPLYARDEKPVQLRNVKVAYVPRSYYISAVVDERSHQEDIGDLTMPEGAAVAIEQFLATNVKQDRKAQPIELYIKKIDFDVQRKGNFWHVNSTVNFAFYAGDQMLVELTGGGRADINTDPALFAEGFIRQILESDLKKFDIWWAQNRDRVPTASTVKVHFVLANNTDEQDAIVYSASRPLRVGDFKGRTGSNPQEMAMTCSGNQYDYKVTTEKGQITVYYTITPCFYMHKSWFKDSDDERRVLAHEQLHFDITALKTCEFITKMRNVAFTKSNYQAILDKLPDEINEETNKMQESYDGESNHGIIVDKQLYWEAKVKQLMKQTTCY